MKDANGQSLAYVYVHETKADADIAKVLTMDEARRVASNIAKLPTLFSRELVARNDERTRRTHMAEEKSLRKS